MSGWKRARFSDVAEVVTGTTPPKSEANYYGGSIPFVTPAELDGADPILEASTTLTQEGADRARVLPAGTVLVCCIGSLGKVGFAGRPLVTNQQINALTFHPFKILARYGYHYARTLKPLLDGMAPATTVPIVNKSRFSAIEIPIPPLHEQRRIADILDKADAVRRKRKEAIALTEDLLRSTFLEMFGDPVANPKGWPLQPLANLAADMKYGTSEKCSEDAPEGALPVLRIPNVAQGDVAWDDLKYASLSGAEVERLRLVRGDMLFVRSNGNPEYIGRCAVYTAHREALFASYLIRVRLRYDSACQPEYVQAALSTPSYRAVLTRAARTTAGNYNISTEGLRRLVIPVPPSELQKRFLRFRARVGVLVEQRLAPALDAGEQLFKSLVDRAFRGELNHMGASLKTQLEMFDGAGVG